MGSEDSNSAKREKEKEKEKGVSGGRHSDMMRPVGQNAECSMDIFDELRDEMR